MMEDMMETHQMLQCLVKIAAECIRAADGIISILIEVLEVLLQAENR